MGGRFSERLPREDQAVVALVVEYLSGSDLARCNIDTLTEALGASRNTIGNRLRRAGTGWQELKTTEKERRLAEILARPGRLNPDSAATELGFWEVNSFFRFFQQVYGENYTTWRLRRQAA